MTSLILLCIASPQTVHAVHEPCDWLTLPGNQRVNATSAVKYARIELHSQFRVAHVAPCPTVTVQHQVLVEAGVVVVVQLRGIDDGSRHAETEIPSNV